MTCYSGLGNLSLKKDLPVSDLLNHGDILFMWAAYRGTEWLVTQASVPLPSSQNNLRGYSVLDSWAPKRKEPNISHHSVLKHPCDTQRDVERPPPPSASLRSCFMPRIQQVPSSSHTHTHSSIHVCQAPTTCLAMPEYE